ncbi:MAG: prolipoprotein diacylglyceryl transferase [Erysipelotrichaceae bacterium]|nr:prolipoprotein diacylglyceryl transferase [Erysipelotrichaceae bacterium]MDY5251496.1 prolipoprotein diacylglyceryl transferase [Erysipelotrichaceae bacterium]
MFDLALFIILLIVYKLQKDDGIATSIYLLVYSVERFIIEFYRGDSVRGFIGVLSTSQFIAIFMFVIGGYLLYKKLIHNAKIKNC